MFPDPKPTLTRTVIDSLHIEAMVLADEARFYFDGEGMAERSKLMPVQRVLFSCESLKVTTRLMHCVAWLIPRRCPDDDRSQPRLGKADGSLIDVIAALPFDAQHIIEASGELYDRIARLDDQMRLGVSVFNNPALSLQRSVERAF